MGGNALKNVVTRRYQRDEYQRLKEKILEKIRPHVDRAEVPREFPSKESFGDLDVLIVCPSTIKMNDLITEQFHPNEISPNGNVYSFDVEQFQIDFILIPAEQIENAIVYFSYSDLGGLIGNICHKIGLKYGSQGLWMNVHTKEFDPTTTSTQLMLSRNVEEIFSFLDFDFQRYSKGFENENEFFQWIVDSRYFRRFYFDPEQLNHANRQRTAKRPIYLKFIDFLSRKNVERGENVDISQEVRQRALTFFNKQNEYDQGIQTRLEREKAKLKYNGRMFIDIASNRQMIGVLKEKFERRIAPTNGEFERWLAENDVERIREEIDKFKLEIKQTNNDDEK